MDNFSNILKDARNKKGLSLHAASVALGLSLAFLHRLEHGRYAKLTYPVLVRLASFYDLDVDRLAAVKGMLPPDVQSKLLRNPELIALIREYDIGGF